MICIKWLRQNAHTYDTILENRGAQPCAQELLQQDKELREQIQVVEALYQKRNSIAKSDLSIEEKKELAQTVKADIATQEAALQTRQEAFNHTIARLPNLLHEHTPLGKDHTHNQVIKTWAEPKTFSFTPKEHNAFTQLGVDDAAGAALSGSRFSVLRRQAARLEYALQRFMVEQQIRNGYELVSTPVLVRDKTLFNTGQLPKFESDLFSTNSSHWLIPTAEVTLTSLYAGSTIQEQQLPIAITALTNCFRAEAGAAGRQTKGLIRQHQFSKVELVRIVHPDQGLQELELMTTHAESILEALELPYRRLLLCSGDIGFGAIKTYDLEVWMASQNDFMEISSCSLCGDFQARRMGAKLKTANGTTLPATLNGSGLAVGRTLAAIIEYYQKEDLSIETPKALLPYMVD